MKVKSFPKYYHYDEILDDNNNTTDTMTAFGGKTEKVFVRMDSDFLSDLFVAKSRGNSSYVTYLDSLFDNYSYTRQGPPLKTISVLLKSYNSMQSEGYACGEEIASRIGNAMGIPVVYNKHIVGVDPQKEQELDLSLIDYIQRYARGEQEKHHIVSVDFMEYSADISYDTIFKGYSKGAACRYSRGNWSLRDWYKFFLFEEDFVNPKTGEKVPLQDRKKLTRDFIQMYLFRKYVISDSDFDIHNIVIKHDARANLYTFGPNYDMERAFCKNTDDDIYEIKFLEDIEFAYKAYPKEIDDFMKKVKAMKKNIPSIVAGVDNTFFRNKYKRNLEKNVNLMMGVYNSNTFARFKQSLAAESEGMDRK